MESTLTVHDAKSIARYVLKEIKKSSYSYSSDSKLDAAKASIGKLKGGTIGPVSPEFQNYVCSIEWSAIDDDEIEWTDGYLTLADGRSQYLTSGIQVLSASGLNYFYGLIGTEDVQHTINYYNGVGPNKALLAFATIAPENDQVALVYPFNGTEPTFNSSVLGVNMVLAAHIKAGVITATHIATGTITADKLTFSAFQIGVNDLDDVADGTTYSKVKTTSITAGEIILSETIQSATARYSSDSEKSYWNGKPDDMDDISDGTTWKKVRYTNVTTAGYIKLTAETEASGSWYSYGGIILDADDGIYIDGEAMYFRDSGSTERGRIYGYTSNNLLIKATTGNLEILTSNGSFSWTFGYTGSVGRFNPGLSTYKMGDLTPFGELHSYKILAPTTGTTRLRIPVGPNMYD